MLPIISNIRIIGLDGEVNMTILELYEYAKERDILDYDVEAQYDSCGIYEGTRDVWPETIEIDDNFKRIIL